MVQTILKEERFVIGTALTKEMIEKINSICLERGLSRAEYLRAIIIRELFKDEKT